MPYVGLGANWTVFFEEKFDSGANGLNLDPSFGVSGQLGFDWVFSNNWLLNLDVRYIGIETDAFVDGAPLGKISIDPWVAGINVGYKF